MSDTILLEDLEIYQLAMEVGEMVWQIVDKWEYLNKKSVGTQYTSAADSIAANIAEGYGRYFYKDRRQFCFYSRGSLLETKTWTTKAFTRKLVEEKDYFLLIEKLKTLHHKLNIYIKKLKENISNNKNE
ncbi:MAG: four helix bundle protein [Ferruginibacter sp.]|nr:four helix bundle protein [Ferruginibacter sp.]